MHSIGTDCASPLSQARGQWHDLPRAEKVAVKERVASIKAGKPADVDVGKFHRKYKVDWCGNWPKKWNGVVVDAEHVFAHTDHCETWMVCTLFVLFCRCR